MRFAMLLVLLLLVACTPQAPIATSSPAASPVRPTGTPNPEAARWAVDGGRAIGRDGGIIRAPLAAIDSHGHAHVVYQSSLEWLEALNEGAVIVTGVTPAGARYERRLATGDAGRATSGIGAWEERIVVTAGVRPPGGGASTIHVWQSPDGGVSWAAAPTPFGADSYQADVGFLPDGRIVLAATVASGGLRTVLLVETATGWDVVHPVAGWGAHTLLTRDPHDPAQASLPALVLLVSQPGGFAIARSDDGSSWQTSLVASDEAYHPHMVAAGGTLLVTHEVYGARGAWLAQSRDGGVTWQVAQAFRDADWHAVTSAPLWDRASGRVFLVLARMSLRSRDQRLVVVSAALDDYVNPVAWTPDWLGADAWLPIALPPTQTQQTTPATVQRHDTAVLVWIGRYEPADYLAQKLVAGGEQVTTSVMLTTLRLAALGQTWRSTEEER
jgi:hypothetical protein